MLAALALGGWIFMQGQKSAAPTALTPTPASAISQANAVATKLNAHNLATKLGKPVTVATAAVVAKPVAAPAAKPKVVVKVTTPAAAAATKKAVVTRVVKPAVVKHVAKLPNGTPNTIATLLSTHAVVVVLLYDPRSKVDYYTFTEAQLGAQQAGAGFLSVDVLNQRQAAPFTRAYGVLQDPTIMFFVHPGRLVQQFSGFADHETVSQAANNEAVKSGWVQKKTAGAAATTTNRTLVVWRTKANAVCVTNQAGTRQALLVTASDAEVTVYARGLEKQINRDVIGLSALALPAAASDRALVATFIESLKKMGRDVESYLQARLKHDTVTANSRYVVVKQDTARSTKLSTQLAVLECG